MKDVALVVVDMLYDFIDGSLACKNAEQAVDAAKAFIDKMTGRSEQSPEVIYGLFPVLFVCDHHPRNHSSFSEFGGPWPAHCVAGTRGAEVHEKLQPYRCEELCFYKGENPAEEQYSGFDGRNAAGQSLGEVLGLLGIRNVYVCGIATEYCIYNSCADLKKAGFTVYLLKDCLGYVDYEGHLEALARMGKEGIRLI